MENDPLQNIVKSPDYIQGYKDGRFDLALSVNSLAIEIEDFSKRLNSTIERKKSHARIEVWGIKSGNILITKKFDTKEAAWEEVYKICGDKIPVEKSSFKVIRIS